jgi:DNA-nicking Smr family endonuclease
LRHRRPAGYPEVTILPSHGIPESRIMAKLKLDLHDIFNKGGRIDDELERIIHDAVQKRITLVEIIPGKGSGQLKKRVLRFLERPDIKQLYHRIEKDSKNFGRVFVHFRF